MPRPRLHVDALTMEDRLSRSVLRTAVSSAFVGLAIALAIAPGAIAKQPACAGADTPTSNVKQIQKTMFCLHNVERRHHGLSQMRWNRDLAGAAGGHARDMVSRRYFAHVSPAGHDHLDRVAASGYQPAAGCWTAGENLLVSDGPSTPRQLFAAWMHSPAHRRNVLHRGWDDFAVGVGAKSTQGNPNGLTLVALFGTRSQQLCG